MSYGYKGLSGATTALTTSSAFLVSASEDRFLRLHSTFPPPPQVGQQQEEKGEVLDKLYVKVKPTVVVWDGVVDVSTNEDVAGEGEGSDDENDDAVWDELDDVDSEDEAVKRKKSKAR